MVISGGFRLLWKVYGNEKPANSKSNRKFASLLAVKKAPDRSGA